MISLFTQSAFDSLSEADAAYAAERANAVLNAYVQCLEKVYGDARLGSYHGKPLLWSIDEKPESTHSVRLIDLERLKTTGPR